MFSSTEEKMLSIAKNLNQLNKQGKVKSFQGNEKGYAKVIEIKRGCSIWVHHLKDDRLIIDLMISESAQSKYPEISRETINKFKDCVNCFTEEEPWQHSIDTKVNAKRYYVDVTKFSIDRILVILNNMLKNMV